MSAVADIGLPSANSAAVGYFVDQKKGEVNELKQVSFIRNDNSESFVCIALANDFQTVLLTYFY